MGVSTRCNYEVILQLPLVTVISQVNAGVDILIFHPLKSRHVRVPPGRVAAEKVIRLTWQFILARYLRGLAASHDLHAYHRGGYCHRLAGNSPAGWPGRPWLAQNRHRLRRSQE